MAKHDKRVGKQVRVGFLGCFMVCIGTPAVDHPSDETILDFFNIPELFSIINT